MNGYKVECYIYDDNVEKKMESYFRHPIQKREWASKQEAIALSSFYGTDIKINTIV